MALDPEIEALRAEYEQVEAYVAEIEADEKRPGARQALEIAKQVLKELDATS